MFSIYVYLVVPILTTDGFQNKSFTTDLSGVVHLQSASIRVKFDLNHICFLLLFFIPLFFLFCLTSNPTEYPCFKRPSLMMGGSNFYPFVISTSCLFHYINFSSFVNGIILVKNTTITYFCQG